MRAIILLAILAVAITATRLDLNPVPTADLDVLALRSEIADEVNGLRTTWTASAHQPGSAIYGKSIKEVKQMLGAKRFMSLPLKTEFEVSAEDVPATFDSRTQWPQCKSIANIRDQSSCGSCWAFSSSEAMSDRTCISTGKNVVLAPEDINSCCNYCGMGCNGGDPGAAFNYWVKKGVHTEECMPYSFPSCDHHVANSTNPCPASKPTPPCKKECVNGADFKADLHFGSKAYSVRGAAAIQQEIVAHGPVSAAFMVYEDFLSYKSGVYKRVSGRFLGGHAVKLIGWGTENGQDYWLVANSWNPNWGDKGLFKIARGHNECNFESRIDAGLAA